MTRLTKEVLFFGQPATVSCDGHCTKAWGHQCRPRIGGNESAAYVPDDELAFAPEDPGTYEGGDAKPYPYPMTGDAMNRWCVRQCERSAIRNGWSSTQPHPVDRSET